MTVEKCGQAEQTVDSATRESSSLRDEMRDGPEAGKGPRRGHKPASEAARRLNIQSNKHLGTNTGCRAHFQVLRTQQ